MPLSSGTRLGPCEILAPPGAGGVGEVCHARDSRLNREVAIKSLPAAFAQDKERLARFEREAQVMEVENDRPRPVMEFVTGEEPNFQGRKCPCL